MENQPVLHSNEVQEKKIIVTQLDLEAFNNKIEKVSLISF